MLANVLRSDVAINMSIQIVRIFSHMKHVISSHDTLYKKITSFESRLDDVDASLSELWFELSKFLEHDDADNQRKI